jgi:uncharacterized protein DUF4058
MASVGLQDHFHPPLSTRRHWHAFHNAWATYLASDLNAALPQGYFAEPNVQFGIEIDVATFEESGASGNGAHTPGWTPPAPVQTIPLSMATDLVEVLVYDSREGPTLAGAIELVSPANKDRPAHRQAFVSKCESYLQSGAGLLIVDVVTGRGGSLHDELLKRLDASAVPIDSDLYAAAYHAVERETKPALDVWQSRLELGGELPTMPLFLRGGVVLPVDLGRSYGRTCSEQRIPVFA